MERFLKAKHWQIFMVTIGLPVILEIIAIPFIVMGNNPMVILKIMPAMMILIFAGYFGWSWAVAINLQEKLTDDLKLSVKRFKTFLLIPIVYFVIFFIFFDLTMNDAIKNGIGPNPADFVWFIPFHLFAMFCIFYCLYFVAKVFKTVELQRKVTFSDFAGEFFMIWVFFIGIWIIQPKINKMMEDKGNVQKEIV